MGTSTKPRRAASPPTRRVMNVITALADSPDGRTSTQLATQCGISTSTCALILAELSEAGWIERRDDLRYALGSGLFSVMRGLRHRFPLLDRGRAALEGLHHQLAAGCSLSRIDRRHLTLIDAVGHGAGEANGVGQQFPLDPPFGLVAMAWHDADAVTAWLTAVTPRLTATDIERHRLVLADIRARGYGAWRFDESNGTLHGRLAGLLGSLEPTESLAKDLSRLMTMTTLQSVTDTLETDLQSTEFIVIPIFGRSGRPEYQIEVHLGNAAELTIDTLTAAIGAAQQQIGSASP